MDRYKFFRGAPGRAGSKAQETMNLFGKRKNRYDGDIQDGRESKRAAESQSKSSPSSNPVISTVENMGNTCFVNAVIYSLRFIPMFTNKLHDLVLHSGDLIAKESKLKDSLELKLLRALHRNYLNMFQNECISQSGRNSIKPSSFLKAMREIHPEFRDNT